MRIRYAAKTDVGMKRTHNEDYFSLIEDEQLFLVADGMGGHASGEVASKMAAEDMQEFYQRTEGRGRDLALQDGPARSPTSRTGWSAASSWPTCASSRPSCRDIRYKGMGTTIVSGWSWATRSTSRTSATRAATASATARIQQLTRDHSLLEDYKEAKPDMTEEEERNFPHKNVITRALGMRETVQVDMLAHDIRTGTSSCSARTACPAWSTTRRSWNWSKGSADLERAVSSWSTRRTRPAARTTSPCWRCSARTDLGPPATTSKR